MNLDDIKRLVEGYIAACGTEDKVRAPSATTNDPNIYWPRR